MTVKSPVLVAVPLGVMIRQRAIPGGAAAKTVTRSSVAEMTVNWQGWKPSVTELTFTKFVPVIVTTVPGGPMVGVKPVIVGGPGAVTVKKPGLSAVPLAVVTRHLAMPGFAFGTQAWIRVGDKTVNVEARKPSETELTFTKFVPVIVTMVSGVPFVGVKPVIVGGPTWDWVTVKLVELVAVPPAVVTEIWPVVAAPGTVAVIWVLELTA